MGASGFVVVRLAKSRFVCIIDQLMKLFSKVTIRFFYILTFYCCVYFS